MKLKEIIRGKVMLLIALINAKNILNKKLIKRFKNNLLLL